MKPFLSSILCLACLAGFGCAKFQSSERNRAAKKYDELGLWSENKNEQGKIPELPDGSKPISWIKLFNGKDLTGWKETDYAGRGNVKVKNGELHIENGLVITGVTFTNKTILPKTNYEVEYEAKKVNGTDFFGLLTFPVGDSHASLVTGGWGGAVTGISSINSMDASENDTTVYLKFNKNQWYKFRLRVTPDNLSVWMTPREYLVPLKATVASIVKAYQDEAAKNGTKLTAEAAEKTLRQLNPELEKNIPARDTIYFPGESQIIDEPIKDKVIEMRVGEIELSAPLGFATFQSYGVIRNVRLRKLK
ncbi:MAG: DUF1080 domain-containing protein [Verrucomicrobiota bacterium]|jgi:hypothetical protein|nr:DUF1080 domain-containing protein [Verrucomicrobiota bacterium]